MNPLDIANSGSMPITGGAATATVGDQRFEGQASFGGINNGGTGVNPWLLAGLAVLVVVGYVAVKRA